MKFPIITVRNLPAFGMAIFPFILVKFKDLKENKPILNHEKIHLKQQMELLIIPFYILYIFNYLLNFLRYKNHHKAYRNIIFEKEAFENENNLNYLVSRKLYAWVKYL